MDLYNDRLTQLNPYPFERLRALTADIEPAANAAHIPLSLGEPKHPPPPFVIDTLADRTTLETLIATYPATKGSDELREAIADWLKLRFDVAVDPEAEVLPVNGTREALFSFAQAVVSPQATVLMPNPFYQIYEGAALLAGARPSFVSSYRAKDYAQDFTTIDAATWQATQFSSLINMRPCSTPDALPALR